MFTLIYFSSWIIDEPFQALDFFVLGLNSITSMTDIVVSKRPCRILHVYHPLVALLAYTAFSAIYWAAGGRDSNGLSYIYPILNWENLKLNVPFATIGLIVLLPIVHIMLWVLHLLRDWAFSKTNVNRQNEENVNRHSHSENGSEQ